MLIYVKKAEKEISAHGGSLLSFGGLRGSVGFRLNLFHRGGNGNGGGSSYFRGRHYGVDNRELGTVG